MESCRRTGIKLKIKMVMGEYISFLLDGREITPETSDDDLLVINAPESDHTLKIIMTRHSKLRFWGVYSGQETKLFKTVNNKYIQFIGDSITDAYPGFSTIVANNLGVDYSIVSLCGIALVDRCSPLDIQTITDVREKMMLNIDNHWTTTKLAMAAQMSHSKFHYIYKTYFGISPIDDLINARIQSAKDILVSENITIRELASKLGYSDVTHFIRQFTSKVGISPKQYAVKYS